jgi:hypothetical protein
LLYVDEQPHAVLVHAGIVYERADCEYRPVELGETLCE